jgi:hypothetical protein
MKKDCNMKKKCAPPTLQYFQISYYWCLRGLTMFHDRLDVPLEVKSFGDDYTFAGYGSVFDVADIEKEIVVRGAFQKSLNNWQMKGSLPAMLWQHDMRQPIGVYTKMVEDARGLYVEGKIIQEVEKGREAYALLKAGAISGLSIGFITRDSELDNYSRMRKIKQVDLIELSIVTMPANQEAMVTLVKAASTIEGVRDCERLLRNAGFSQKQAKAMAGAYKDFSQCDADEDSEMKQRDVANCALIALLGGLEQTILGVK